MFDFTKMNNNANPFTIDTEGYKFNSSTEWHANHGGELVTVAGFFINKKSKFGPHPVAIVPQYKTLIDLPTHMLANVNEIINSPEAVQAVNNGSCGLVSRTYRSKNFNRECVGFDFVNIE